MIDLSQSPAASPRVQTLESEPVNANVCIFVSAADASVPAGNWR